MKRQLLYALFTLLCVAGFSQTANALNAYAYGLNSEVKDGQVTLNYSLNDAAKSVNVVIMNGDTEVQGLTGGTAAGENSVSIAAEKLPAGEKLTWKVVVDGATVDIPTVEPEKAYRFYHPQGVDVDVNPESPYFGRVYTTECMPSPTDIYASVNVGQALYVYDPQLKPVLNADGKQGFKGGMETLENLTVNGSLKTCYEPRKVRISDDGRVFLTRQKNGVSSLVEVNPADLNAPFTDVFTGFTAAEDFSLNTADGAFMTAPNVAFDVKGSGKDLKFVMLSSTSAGFEFSYSGFSCDEYNLGTATTWSAAPSKNISWLTGQYTISPTSANVVYDNRGGIWYCQYRGTPTEDQPALVHINADGVEDYKDITTVCGGGGIRFNNDFTLLAVANAKKRIGVYEVNIKPDGTPNLVLKYEFDTTIGSNCNDIAWDYANNLYIVGNSGEWLKVFALPRTDGTVTTPAAEKYAFTIEPAATYPADMYVIGNIGSTDFDGSSTANKMTTTADGIYEITGIEICGTTYGYFSFTATPSTDWSVVNANRYGPAVNDTEVTSGVEADIAQIADGSYKILTGVYTFKVDLTTGKFLATRTGGEDPKPVEYPAQLYAIGDFNGWDVSDGNCVFSAVEGGTAGQYSGQINIPKVETGYSYFTFGGALGTSASDWATFNAHRYGPAVDGTELVLETAADIVTPSEWAYKIATPGDLTCTINIDLAAGTIILTKSVGVEKTTAADAAKAIGNNGEITVIGNAKNIEVYTMGGALVSKGETSIACPAGYYVVVIDGKATKVVVK